MDDAAGSALRKHGSSWQDGGETTQSPLRRHRSSQSNASFFEDVEMAQDELYSGPVAESLPTSVSAFSHRRSRTDSIASFSFYEDDIATSVGPADLSASLGSGRDDRHMEFSSGDESDLENIRFGLTDEGHLLDDIEYGITQDDYVLRRCSSSRSQSSARAHLLRRGSIATAASSHQDGRCSQKVYLVDEDLTIVIAGFSTSSFAYTIYVFLCAITCGSLFLMFRWVPRWYVGFVGRPCALGTCDWVVVENEWGEMAIVPVKAWNYGRPVSSVFSHCPGFSTLAADDEGDPFLDTLRIVDYRYVRLIFHPLRDKFIVVNDWKDPAWTDVRLICSGLDSDEKSSRRVIFGRNLLDIEQKSVGKLLVDEALHPFYVFQMASLILWSLDSYYYYAVCIFIISVGSIAATIIETRANMSRLREVSRFECDVRVLRNGFWKYISSSDLVPGDVYELSDPNLTQFPSDSLLLSGDCIVNESMLTGESVPVSKLPATNDALRNIDLGASSVSPEIARHFLFCGTKIIRTRRPQEDQDVDAAALALVVRTGFNTTKGALIRSMLFPKPSYFTFYRDSFRYIGVMAIVASIGFIVSFANFIALGLAWRLIIVRALDLITIVVPPALPATLAIGTNFALSRLKKKQIFCISPQRVNVGGKLDIICFDKTGTLTEDGLDVFGIRVVCQSSNTFGGVFSKAPKMDISNSTSGLLSSLQATLYTMATCHSLRSVDGELIGDPLDVKMFGFSGWILDESRQRVAETEDETQGGLSPLIARPPDESFELGVLKSFEFVSQLRRTSVVVRHFGHKSGDIFVKGAPEALRDICRQESFPHDYEELLSYYTHKGYRVIGCATKHLPLLSWVKAQKMSRSEVESGLDFVGFIIFENKLKPATTPVLRELIDSNINTVMVTGDNILTAISVARECGLIDRHAHCFVPRFMKGDARDPTAELHWESIDQGAYHLDGSSLMPLPIPPEGDASLPNAISNLRNFSLAISGEAFRWIIDYGSPHILRRVLIKGKVFARMSPDEKHELVEKLQSIGFRCGFCGDGANDCGALKAADVGISLSEAEASVAAPFTSRVFDIRCVLDVIREGRAALVTSFSCFKYMSLYSAIQFTSVSFLYAKGSNLGDFQFLFIDLLLILPIAVFMGWSGPAARLSRQRPTAELVSCKVLVPLLGLVCICVCIQAVAYVTVREQSWYRPPKEKHDESSVESSENTTLFLTSCFEYIYSGLLLNPGPPFRQPFKKNWPFAVTIGLALSTTAYMILAPTDWIKHIMQLTKISSDYKLFLIGLGLAYLAMAWTFAAYAAAPLAKCFRRARQMATGKTKRRKEYKVIEEEMHFHGG